MDSFAKSNGFLSELCKKRQTGVVEFVNNNQRLKIFIPNKFRLSFVISGIRSSTAKLPDLHQKQVDLEFVSVDKSGAFIGNLYYLQKDYSIHLLETGNAEIISYNKPNIVEMQKAQDFAKSNHLGMFKDFAIPFEKVVEKDCVISEIDPLYIQFTENGI